MDLLAIAIALVSLVGVLMLKLAFSELQDWMPWIARRMINRTITKLPIAERDRYREEWYAHLEECPGKIGKILHAIGCAYGVRKLAALANESASKNPEQGASTESTESADYSLTRDAAHQAEMFASYLLTRNAIRIEGVDYDKIDFLMRNEKGEVSIFENKYSLETGKNTVRVESRRFQRRHSAIEVRRTVYKKAKKKRN